MKLTELDALNRLATHDHGVLSTVHAERGVDAVPVVYAVVDGFVGVPVDRVKAKSSSRLRRQHNLEVDPRASLLIEHWDRHDWSQLWWVRAQLRYESAPESDLASALADRLADTFEQYQDHPFHAMLVMRIGNVTGWSAGAT